LRRARSSWWSDEARSWRVYRHRGAGRSRGGPYSSIRPLKLPPGEYEAFMEAIAEMRNPRHFRRVPGLVVESALP